MSGRAQRQATPTQQTDIRVDAQAPQQGAQSNAQAQAALRGENGAAPAAEGQAQQTPRQQFIAGYRTFLQTRTTEIAELTGDTKARRVEGLLLQVETVSSQLAAGTVPDLATLATAPTTEGGTTASDVSGFVPPELIPAVRALIRTLEVGVADATAGTDTQVEGSAHSADDWNSRLGVPQYRTQSDNLTSPEATCNVTSFAMVLERLGYSRADVVTAVETELKKAWLRSQRRDPAREDLSQIELPEGEWERRVRTFLDNENAAGSGYQRLRGGTTTNAQRANMAETFQADAQMEDLVAFLMSQLGISRTSITGNAGTILNRVEPTAAERPTQETLTRGGANTWPVVKERMRTTLDAGGAVMLSLFHKGRGQTGTHIVTVQQVTGDGIVIDDPYGGMRATYRRDQTGDAYADVGSTRGASAYRNRVGANDTDADGVDDDWRVRRAQDPAANESRGESDTITDTQMSGAWNYVSLFSRAAPAAAVAPAAGANGNAQTTAQ